MKQIALKRCVICGFSRVVDEAHIANTWKEAMTIFHGGNLTNKTTYMCPNHHRLYDRHLLVDEEIESLPELFKLYYTTDKSQRLAVFKIRSKRHREAPVEKKRDAPVHCGRMIYTEGEKEQLLHEVFG